MRFSKDDARWLRHSLTSTCSVVAPDASGESHADREKRARKFHGELPVRVPLRKRYNVSRSVSRDAAYVTSPQRRWCAVREHEPAPRELRYGVGYDKIFQLTPGGSLTFLYTFPAGSGPSQLMQASDGMLYGVTRYGGAGDGGNVFAGYGTVFRLTLPQ